MSSALGHPAQGTDETHAAARVAALWHALRPSQWIKNAFVWAPLFFGGQLHNAHAFEKTGIAFLAFCAAASSVYLLNDLMDRKRDMQHPTKRLRPIASGALPVPAAITVAIVLSMCALAASVFVNYSTLLALSCYVALNVLYSAVLKHIVIVDVFCIAAGFVLRIFGGAAAAAVEPSIWIVMMTFLLALFLALGKRRQELALAKLHAPEQRPVLESYTMRLADELISVVTPVIVIAYLLYTIDAATVARFRAPHLYVTAFPVVFGIFRYLFLIHVRAQGESPTKVVLSDWPLMTAIVVWVGLFFGVIYDRL